MFSKVYNHESLVT